MECRLKKYKDNSIYHQNESQQGLEKLHFVQA